MGGVTEEATWCGRERELEGRGRGVGFREVTEWREFGGRRRRGGGGEVLRTIASLTFGIR